MALPYPYKAVKDPLSLPPGYLRHEIHIQKQADGNRDCDGGQGTTWTDLYVALAAIDTVSFKEVFQSTQSAQFASQVTHRFTLRWPGEIGIVADMRVTFGQNQSHSGTILAPENVQMRNRVLYLWVQETNGSQ